MAQQVRLRNNLVISFLLLFCSCVEQKQPVISHAEVVNITDANFTMVKGFLCKNFAPFNGIVFTLFPGTNDTAEIKNFHQGLEHGVWKKFYGNGSIKEIRFFSNGKKTGEYITWWENGNKQLHYYFENDEYEGNCKEWNADGVLTKDMHYKKSREEGAQRWWYDNGKIRANYVVKGGRRFGLLGTKNCMNVSDSIFKN